MPDVRHLTTPVQDPFEEMLVAQQPAEDLVAFQRARLASQAADLGFRPGA